MPAKKKTTQTTAAAADSGTTRRTVALDRDRLRGIAPAPETDDSGSVRAIILLVIIIAIVAVGGAYFIRQAQTTNTSDDSEIVEEDTENLDTDVTITATPGEEMTLQEKVVSTEVLSDTNISAMPSIDSFSKDDMVLEATAEGEYTLMQIEAQPYKSIYQISFSFDGDNLPAVELNYRNAVPELLMTLNGVIGDESGFEDGISVDVSDSVVNSIEKMASESEDTVVYRISLSEANHYSLKQSDNKLVLDISELSEESLSELDTVEATEESEEEETTEESSETKTTAPTGSRQDIKSDVEGNGAGIKGYSFGDKIDRFVFELVLSNDEDPNVFSKVDSDGKMTMTVENLAFDGTARNNESRDFSKIGVRNVTSFDSSFDGSTGTSTYNFMAEDLSEYKISVAEDEDLGERYIRVEIYR